MKRGQSVAFTKESNKFFVFREEKLTKFIFHNDVYEQCCIEITLNNFVITPLSEAVGAGSRPRCLWLLKEFSRREGGGAGTESLTMETCIRAVKRKLCFKIKKALNFVVHKKM